MTDHEQFQQNPQDPQDPQVVVFSPELLKLADRRRQALEDIRQAAEDGDANAVVQMGMNCLYGIGGEAKDPGKAFRWFSQTAPDDPAGLYWLGVCYDNGFGVEQDEDRACRLYQESAQQDYAPALCNLGVCYESGQGVEKDLKKAVELYRRAAEGGYPMGRCNLGVMYHSGLGVEKDPKKAAYCFAQAAEQRLPRAVSAGAVLRVRRRGGEGRVPGPGPVPGGRRGRISRRPVRPGGAASPGQGGGAGRPGGRPSVPPGGGGRLFPGLALPGPEL